MKTPRKKYKETEMGIRRANEKDSQAIHLVLRKGFHVLSNRGYSTKAIKAAILSLKQIQQRLHSPEIIVLVATNKDQIIGTVTGTKRFGHLHIQSLAVHPRFQRHRVGSRLVLALEGHARQNNCSKLFVQTAWAMVEAIRLYWRLGFDLEGYHPGHFWGEDLLSLGKIL